MSRRRLQLLLALGAALVVPIQAVGGEEQPKLEVTASLDHCGVGGATIMCKIDASWSGLDEADSYTATVTLADGSVQDLGILGTGAEGGSAALWVPFAGNGVYTVTVTAWGTDPDGGKQKLEEKDAAAKKEGDGSETGEKPSDDGGEKSEEKEGAAEAEGKDSGEQAPSPDEQPDASADGQEQQPDPGAEVEIDADEPAAEQPAEPAAQQPAAAKAPAEGADGA